MARPALELLQPRLVAMASASEETYVRALKAVGIIILGAIVWTIAKNLTHNRLGAIPTLIIVGPFFYWARRAWRSDRPDQVVSARLSDAGETQRRLEEAASNQNLSIATREEAKQRLADLRKDSEPRA